MFENIKKFCDSFINGNIKMACVVANWKGVTVKAIWWLFLYIMFNL